MDSFEQATADLIRRSDVAQQVQLCDVLIRAYNKLPSAFVLPRQHAHLAEFISAFASDQEGWVNFVKIVRDAVTGAAKDELHNIYRSVSIRALQHERRSRVRKAVQLLMQQHNVSLSFDDQMIAIRAIELYWKQERSDAMAAARQQYKTGRQPMEDKQQMLNEFWRTIDMKLDAGMFNVSPELIEKLRKQGLPL